MSIYSIGNGKANGELGSGSFEEKLDPILLETIKGKSIVEIKSCEANALAITVKYGHPKQTTPPRFNLTHNLYWMFPDTGDLYMWGRNREGTLGNGSNNKSSAIPLKVGGILEGERICTATIGWNHVVAVTKQGKVYHWGKLYQVASANENKDYFGISVKMTGLATEQEDESTARKRRLLDRSHRAYYSNKGSKHLENMMKEWPADPASSTSTEAGEHETNMDFGNFVPFIQRTPLLIDELAIMSVKVTKVAAGYGFSLLVTDRGQVWSLGINEKFQLGLGHRFNQDKPQLIKAFAAFGTKIVDVACGQQHSLALDSDNCVWSWGLGVFGQLGHSSLRDEPVPRKLITFTPKNVEVPIDDGDINPAPIDPAIAEASRNIHVVSIACGSQHSLALDSEGKVWSWGSSEYGQQGGMRNYEDLGGRDSKEQHFYYSIPRVLSGAFNGKRPIKIACGNLHNIAVTEDGNLWTWGWGQTGALGHGNRRFQLFPTVVNSLRGDPIHCIAGGARTTFAVTSGTSSSFAFDFQRWVNNPQYSDLEIRAARLKSFSAHKIVVFARCPYLLTCYEMTQRFGSISNKSSRNIVDQKPVNAGPAVPLTEITISSDDGDGSAHIPPPPIPLTPIEKNSFYKSHKDVLSFPNFDPILIQALLVYLYTDHLRCPPHMVVRLATLAKKFKLPRLVALCDRFMMLEEGEKDTGPVGACSIPASTWFADLHEVIDSSRWSDCQLLVTNEVGAETNLYAHRILLHARSEYFATLFSSSFTDSKLSELPLPNVCKEYMLLLLRFMYTNSVANMDSQNIVELLLNSDRFLIEDLKQALELQLEDAIDDDSVFDALMISEATATPRLRNACISRIIGNLEFFKSSPGLLKLKKALPATVRELDFIATRRGLISAGSLLRCQ